MSSPRGSGPPFDPRAWFARFRPHAPAGDYERAVADLERGRSAAALAALEGALAAATDDAARARVHNKRGVALVGLGRRDEALDAFCRALEYDEACAPALVNLGNLFLEDGHVADAIDYYKAALRLDERSALAHENLAAAYKRLGDRVAAVREMRAAGKLAGRRFPGRS